MTGVPPQQTAQAITVLTFLNDVNSLVQSAFSWVSQVVSTVTGNPLILLFVILPLVGLGVGLFRRLINVQ